MQGEKIRYSNFELLRLVAMFLVFAVHANFLALGQPNSQEISQSLPSSLCRLFLHQIALVCVNLFVLISGYFGIHPTVRRVSNLLFAVAFWQTVSWIVGRPHMGLVQFIFAPCRGWFVGTYLELMLIAPLINGFVDAAEKKQFGTFLCIFLCVEILCPIWPAFNGGYSLLHLIGIYLVGRYIKMADSFLLRYSIVTYGSLAIVICLVSSIIVCASSAIAAQMPPCAAASVERVMSKLFHEYSSLPVIVSSVCIFLVFANLKFYSKAINFIGCSAFSMYLFHNYLWDRERGGSLFCNLVKSIFYGHDGLSVILYIIGLILTFMVATLLFDRVRITAWECICAMLRKCTNSDQRR